MLVVIPPICDLTVPLLGAYQMAGYAKTHAYQFSVCDLNIEFCKEIIRYSINRSKDFHGSPWLNDVQLEEVAITNFLNQYPHLTNYESLLDSLKHCKNFKRYWELADYLRACYDLYSLQFDDLRLRLNGCDSGYKWNAWSDIADFMQKYSDGVLMNLIIQLICKINMPEDNIIGLSLTFESQLFFSLLICKALRQMNPSSSLIIGGAFINAFIDCEEAMGPLEDYCDCVYAGEGEALIEFLNNNPSRSIFFNKKIISRQANYFIPQNICSKNLSVAPPSFQTEILNQYLSPKRIIPLRFSYECYWGKCMFCSDKETHICLNKNYDIKKMVDFCINAASSKEIDGIYFLDSAIMPHHLRKFAEAMIKANLAIPWGTNLRFEKTFDDDELINILVQSGCVFVKFGLESGSQRVLNLMNKGIEVDIAASIISKFRKHGVFVHAYVMVGYPGENFEDRLQTKEFLLSSLSHPDNYNCSEFILYGGAKIAEEYKTLLISDENDNYGWRISQYEAFTNHEIQAFIAQTRKEFDSRFKPQSILMSTGHTIAYAGKLSVECSECNEGGYISFSKKVDYHLVNGVPYLFWWKRNNGCQFVQGEWAEYLWKLFHNGVEEKRISEFNIPTPILERLWDDSCLCNTADVNQPELLLIKPNSIPKIETRNRFSHLKWYGQFDAS